MTDSLSHDIRFATQPRIGSNTLERWAQRVEELEDQLSGTAQRAKEFEVKAAELQQQLADMTANRDQIAYALSAVQEERDKAREDRDRNAQEVTGLRAALRAANQNNAALCAHMASGTGTITGTLGGSVGCGQGVSAKPQTLVDVATSKLLGALQDGSWIAYAELRTFVTTIGEGQVK